MHQMIIFNMEELLNELNSVFSKCNCIPACYASILNNTQYLMTVQSLLPDFMEWGKKQEKINTDTEEFNNFMENRSE